MLPLPPRATLFPYTTLFRSLENVFGRSGGAGQSGHAPQRPADARADCPRRKLAAGRRAQSAEHRCTAALPCRAARDRKSTRLNSSHVEISYAVFCLKKKNKN